MNSQTRMTRQGLRDLNHYGPKRVPATTAAPVAVEEPTVAPVVAEPVAATPKVEKDEKDEQ
jgi:hypothetical protein